MCKKCEKQGNLNWDYVEAYITGNVIDISYSAYSCDSSFSIQERINFCPYCGKELIQTKPIIEERIEEEDEEELLVQAISDRRNNPHAKFNVYLLDSKHEIFAVCKIDAKQQFAALGYILSKKDFKDRVVCTQTQIKKS